MQEQILSRSRLQPIIEKFGLYTADRDTVHMEDLVAKLRSAIDVTPLEPMQGTQNRQLPGFHVNVTFDNPQVAQRICSEVTTMFLEENSKHIDVQDRQTEDFFARHVEEAKRNLDDQDAKLAEFKRQYMGSLPDNEPANLGLLTGMNAQLEATTQGVNRAQQDRSMNESLLASQLATWKAVNRGDTPTETLDQQLSALQEQLNSIQARYTSDHPDVIKLKNQVEQLKKRMSEAPKGGSTKANSQVDAIEPPVIQQYRAKLRQDDLNIADLIKQQGKIQNQISVLQGKIQSTPAVEQQFKELTRNYQTALDGYNELLRKHDQVAISGDLNRQQQGENLRVLDPPSLPMTPSFPNKPIFAGAGAGGGLVLGLAILYILAAFDPSMHSERDVEICMQLPVLAMVPNVAPAGRVPSNESGNGFKLTGTRV
jgi:polysaccharide chain length determinant protein (PEP-CTERM system associated)